LDACVWVGTEVETPMALTLLQTKRLMTKRIKAEQRTRKHRVIRQLEDQHRTQTKTGLLRIAEKDNRIIRCA
jgi:hypothetical protein